MSEMFLASQSGEEGVLFFGVVAVILILIVFGAFKNDERAKNLRVAAGRYRGTIVTSFWGNDRLEFVVDGVSAELSYQAGSKNQSRFTKVRFCHTPAGFLRIVPEGIFESLRKMFGAQDIEVGETGFDGAFLIQGLPEQWVREVLNPETRRRISALASLGVSYWNGQHVSLDAGPGGITISCARNFTDDPSQLLAFLDLGVAVFRQIRMPQVDGIKILSAEEHAERGECPVCANPLVRPVSRCSGCGTLHHSDCWSYFGGCAIYACSRRGGRRSSTV
jgi:hypothetical protein